MPNRTRVEELVSYVVKGQFIEALNEFYHQDVVMQENNEAPRIGLLASIERQKQAMQYSMTIYEISAAAIVVEGDHAAIEWHAEWTIPNGNRVRVEEVALQRWQGDKIIHERFFYDTAPLIKAGLTEF